MWLAHFGGETKRELNHIVWLGYGYFIFFDTLFIFVAKKSRFNYRGLRLLFLKAIAFYNSQSLSSYSNAIETILSLSLPSKTLLFNIFFN